MLLVNNKVLYYIVFMKKCMENSEREREREKCREKSCLGLWCR